MRGEAGRWLEEAEWDFETAEYLHRSGRFNAACFYAQQSAEKAVKALLYSINESPWGHSVRELITRFASATKNNVEHLLPQARELDRHYFPSRYPNAHPSGTPHEAYDEVTSKRALSYAKEILSFAKDRIGREKP
ncbi:MAG: HEPN domain-containing protein [Candidatus Freyarchaeota archaeon]|nr:HEPN domain-containing protein [Candidatus Jordarchaeia archaeon]MBS7269209.1 HEPN domain-containing protein [Candidatus Jordarchaeia archaeon]MBS7279570.1 HEPN domain-containing protein [Candidatus Jordarchaeia archaeon]